MRIALFSFILFISNCIYANYNEADSIYIRTTLLLEAQNDSACMYWIQTYSLDPNTIFYFPIDSIKNATSKSTYTSSYNYNTHRSGLAGLGEAFAKLISAPFIALGRIFGATKKATSNNPIASQATPAKRIVPVYATNLYNEMLEKNYYGNRAKLYMFFNKKNPIQINLIDSLHSKNNVAYIDRIIALSVYISDTQSLFQLYSEKRFDPNLNISSLYYSLLNKPLLMALYNADKTLLHFLYQKQVSPKIVSASYHSNLYSLGTNSGIWEANNTKMFRKSYNTYKAIECIRDKNIKKQYKIYLTHIAH